MFLLVTAACWANIVGILIYTIFNTFCSDFISQIIENLYQNDGLKKKSL